MRRTIVAAALAAGGLLIFGLGVAHADEVQVEGSYATLDACQADGPQSRSRKATPTTRIGIAVRATMAFCTCG